MNPTLPHRLSERSFRRFETYIATIVRHFPQVVPLNPEPTGLSITTFRARLCDAILSLQQNNWPTTIVDMEKFPAIGTSIVVSHRQDGRVVAGSRQELRRSVVESVLPELDVNVVLNAQSVKFVGVIALSTTEEKQLACLMVHNRLLNQPLQVSGLSPEDADWLEDNFDVKVHLNEDQTYTIS